ncbi:MAG: hypothetical protein U5Q44_10910 [Dehalococcoidia bacterium]|nr:hypothetical protein [Dehalococcoidia bacterium]
MRSGDLGINPPNPDGLDEWSPLTVEMNRSASVARSIEHEQRAGVVLHGLQPVA